MNKGLLHGGVSPSFTSHHLQQLSWLYFGYTYDLDTFYTARLARSKFICQKYEVYSSLSLMLLFKMLYPNNKINEHPLLTDRRLDHAATQSHAHNKLQPIPGWPCAAHTDHSANSK